MLFGPFFIVLVVVEGGHGDVTGFCHMKNVRKKKMQVMI